MTRTGDALQVLGAQYFSDATLDSFVERVEQLGATSDKEFFQLKQEGNQVALEYSAVLPGAIVDIVLTQTGVTENVLLRAAITHFLVRDTTDRIDVFVNGTSPAGLTYSAVARPLRDNLVRYTHVLRDALLKGQR